MLMIPFKFPTYERVDSKSEQAKMFLFSQVSNENTTGRNYINVRFIFSRKAARMDLKKKIFLRLFPHHSSRTRIYKPR